MFVLDALICKDESLLSPFFALSDAVQYHGMYVIHHV